MGQVAIVLFSLSLQGCVDTLINGFNHNLGAIAGGAIVLGLIQVRVL